MSLFSTDWDSQATCRHLPQACAPETRMHGPDTCCLFRMQTPHGSSRWCPMQAGQLAVGTSCGLDSNAEGSGICPGRLGTE